MKNKESDRNLTSCTECPVQEGRFCTSYKNGASRLVYNPLRPPQGLRQYGEPYEQLESIKNCLDRLREKK